MSCCNNSSWKHQVARGALSDITLPAATEAEEAPTTTGAIDTIFVNGTFLLAEATVPSETVTAVALSRGTIVDVGDAARLLASAPTAAQIDLQGSSLAPGFIEAHAHIIAAVQFNYSADLGINNCATYDDVIATIQTAVDGASPGEWLFFVNYDPSLLDFVPKVGFRQLGFTVFAGIRGADKVNIFVENASGHLAYANATAFTTANVANQKLPGGASYQVDPTTGQYTGVMFEPESFTPFTAFAPKQSLQRVLGAMNGFLKTCQQAGVTTVADPAVGIGGSLEAELALYVMIAIAPERAADVVGSLDISNLYTPGGTTISKAGSLVTRPSRPGGTGSFMGLTIPAVKIWTDGSTQGYTGYLSSAYNPPVTPVGLPTNGSPDWSGDQLQDLLGQARADNWSALVHANGDAAVGMTLTALAAVYGATGGGFRNRIEHCTVTTSDQYDTMKKQNVTPSYLNNHVYIWGDTFNDHILGNARASRLDAAGDAVSKGMIFSFHCDYATSMPEPLRYMQTAVTRQTSSGTVLGIKYAITQLEALKAVTIYPAIQLGIDASVGTITAGKLANFVNLAADPLTVEATTIAKIPVLRTYLRGREIPASASTQAA
jgi:predicted amidohydrolase YtcJ